MFSENLAQEICAWEEVSPISDFGNLRLLSLWDIMKLFALQNFCKALNRAMFLETAHSIVKGIKDFKITNEQMQSIKNAFTSLREQCNKINLTEAVEHIDIALGEFDKPPEKQTPAIAETQLRSTRLKIIQELQRRKFLWVPHDLSGYIDQKELFGPEVKSAFPSADLDIKEAGNCLAVGAYTASVFHLMRAVEWGLRAFCAHLGFRKVKKGKKGQLIPIPYAEWDRILNQLDSYIQKKIDKYKSGPRKQETQEFCNSVVQEIRAIKDAWRNHVMHARRDYSLEDVNAIMAHVKRLMVRLALRLGETKK